MQDWNRVPSQQSQIICLFDQHPWTWIGSKVPFEFPKNTFYLATSWFFNTPQIRRFLAENMPRQILTIQWFLVAAYFSSIIFWNYRCIFLHLWLLICGALNRIHDFISSAIFLSSSSISFARSFSVTRSGTFSRYFSISIWARVVEAALLFSFGLVVFGPEYYASMLTESNGFSNCSLIT